MSAISDFVKKDDLMNLYHLPMKEACKALGVSESSLRNICRKYSIERWPFRKFQQLDQHIESIRHAPASPKNTEMVQVLTLARGIMQKNPNLSVELAIVQGNKQLAVQHQQNQLQATANFLQKQQQQEMMMQQQQPMQQASTSSVSTNTLTPAMQVTPANTTAPATFAQQQPFVQQIPQQQQQQQQNPFLLPHVILPNTSSTNTTAVPTSMSYTQNPFGNVLFADASGVYGYGAMLPNALMMQQLQQQQQQQQQQQMIQQPVHHIKLQQQQQVPSTSTAQQQQPMQSPLLQTSWYPQQQQQQVPSSQQIIIKQSPNLAPTTMERSASTDNTSQFFQ